MRLDTKDFQYLYADGDSLVFMDQDTYDQINLPKDLLGDAAAFLQDGMMVTLEMYDERPISVALPEQVEATIVEADAVVKGQTASSSFKPALLDNGVRVMVPPHIGAGTRIIVDVYERTYVGKAGDMDMHSRALLLAGRDASRGGLGAARRGAAAVRHRVCPRDALGGRPCLALWCSSRSLRASRVGRQGRRTPIVRAGGATPSPTPLPRRRASAARALSRADRQALQWRSPASSA